MNEIVRALLPIPAIIFIAPAVYWFFGKTWRELDEEATIDRAKSVEQNRALDRRVPAALVITALVLLMEEYYGNRATFTEYILPRLEQKWIDGSWPWLHLELYTELYSYAYWTCTKIIGYVVVPFSLWKLLFREDSLLDMGLRTKGFTRHLWIYGLCLAVVIPCMFLVARESDFGTYYPFYKLASRSWVDFIAWETLYFTQFLALELFFRGWLLGALRRSLGSGAIFAMVVPYCMIHFGKPYLEAAGAIIAGVVLGSLSMKTKSIYAGFLVHITVALGMDMLAMSNHGGWPTQWSPPIVWSPSPLPLPTPSDLPDIPPSYLV